MGEGTVEGEVLPRVLELLWERDAPRPGPKPKFGIRDIAAAAIRVADAEGLDAASMARVAAELGVTTMALYRYVDGKDDLLLAMIDTAYGPPPPRAPRGNWRTQLQAWARANHAALLEHPWVVRISISDPPLGPNTTAWMERGLRSFRETGLGQQERLSSLLLVEVYVRGQALLLYNFEGGENPTGDDVYAATLRTLVDPRQHPALLAALASGSLEDDDHDMAGEEFEFGLQIVLDGIAALVAGRAARRQPAK